MQAEVMHKKYLPLTLALAALLTVLAAAGLLSGLLASTMKKEAAAGA